MTYAIPESSVSDGQPYFLYLFDNGTTQTRLTSEPAKLARIGEDWLPSSIAHEELEQTGNIEKASTDFTFPLSDTFARSLLVPATAITTVTMYRGHHTDLSDELRVIWKGRVVGAKSGKQTIKATIESIFTSLRRTGCRVRYQRTCRHALYFDGCNLNIDDFKTAATVTAITGNVLTVPLADDEQDGFYKSGVIIFDGLYGWISNHTGSALTVVLPVPGLADYVTANGSASVFIAPGCDLARATCETKFNNEENFGGFPYMPDNNPFSQSIV